MKIADLFALLRIDPDNKSFAVGNRMLDGIKGQLAAVAGLSAAAFQTKDALDWSMALKRLQVASSGAMGSIENVEKNLLRVSDATGVSKTELLAGTNAFIALTGDGKAAADSMSTFGRVATATGANMEDIAGAAGAMSINLGIGAQDFEKAFSILIAGGKAGAVELKDMAGLMSELAAETQNFEGGQGVEALAELGAAFQIVRRGAGSAAEASTKLKRLMQSFSAQAALIKKHGGVEVFTTDKNGVKRLRTFEEIIQDIANSPLAKDPTILRKALGSSEAVGAFQQLTRIKGEWQELTKETMAANDVAEDYAEVQKNAAAKVFKFWNKTKNLLTRVFAVVVDGLAWLVDNSAIVGTALFGLAAAFTILRFAAIKSALATIASWAVALAPFILIGAAIAALILIVQDLWSWMNGGESVIRDLWAAAVDHVAYAIEFWVELFSKFFKWVMDKIMAIPRAVGRAYDKAKEFVTDLNPFETTGRSWWSSIPIAHASMLETMGLQADGGTLTRAPIERQVAGNSRQSTVNASVTVNAGAADANEVGVRVREQIDSLMRQAASATE